METITTSRFVPISTTRTSYIDDGDEFGTLARSYLHTLLLGNRSEAVELILQAVREGRRIKDIYLKVLAKVQYEAGRLWELNQVSVAQEHYISAATQLVICQLYPQIFATPKCGLSMVACSPAGELHQIGLRMVADFFEMDGWDSYCLGAGSPPSTIVEELRTRRACLLALSVTMQHNVPVLQTIIKAVRAEKDLDGVRILVGGWPCLVNDDLWKELGADGCAGDATHAVELAHRLCDTHISRGRS